MPPKGGKKRGGPVLQRSVHRMATRSTTRSASAQANEVIHEEEHYPERPPLASKGIKSTRNHNAGVGDREVVIQSKGKENRNETQSSTATLDNERISSSGGSTEGQSSQNTNKVSNYAAVPYVSVDHAEEGSRRVRVNSDLMQPMVEDLHDKAATEASSIHKNGRSAEVFEQEFHPAPENASTPLGKFKLAAIPAEHWQATCREDGYPRTTTNPPSPESEDEDGDEDGLESETLIDTDEDEDDGDWDEDEDGYNTYDDDDEENEDPDQSQVVKQNSRKSKKKKKQMEVEVADEDEDITAYYHDEDERGEKGTKAKRGRKGKGIQYEDEDTEYAAYYSDGDEGENEEEEDQPVKRVRARARAKKATKPSKHAGREDDEEIISAFYDVDVGIRGEGDDDLDEDDGAGGFHYTQKKTNDLIPPVATIEDSRAAGGSKAQPKSVKRGGAHHQDKYADQGPSQLDTQTEKPWRSPRRMPQTMVQDFLDGIRGAESFTIEERATIAISLQQKLLQTRRRDWKASLEELMGDVEVAKLVSERIGGSVASCIRPDENRAKRPPAQSQMSKSGVTKASSKGNLKELARRVEPPVEMAIQTSIPVPLPSIIYSRDRGPVPTPRPLPPLMNLEKMKAGRVLKSKFAASLEAAQTGSAIPLTDDRHGLNALPAITEDASASDSIPAQHVENVRPLDRSTVDVVSVHFKKRGVKRPPQPARQPQLPATSRMKDLRDSDAPSNTQGRARSSGDHTRGILPPPPDGGPVNGRPSTVAMRPTGKGSESRNGAGITPAQRKDNVPRQNEKSVPKPGVQYINDARNPGLANQKPKSTGILRPSNQSQVGVRTREKPQSMPPPPRTRFVSSNGDPAPRDGAARAGLPTDNSITEYYAPLQPAHFNDHLLAKKPSTGTRNKKRKGGRKPKGGDGDPSQSGETFNINAHDNDGDSEGEEGEKEKPASSYPCQLKDFTGYDRKVIDRARALFQIYLLNHNAFPTEEEVEDWAKEAYKHAAMFLFKDRYEKLMKPFHPGIKKLLAVEVWSIRGRMKRHVVRLLPRFYPIFPKDGLFERHANPTVATKRFIAQRVSELLGDSALFIHGILTPGGPPIPYAHPAIREMIHQMVFSRSNRTPLATLDIEVFNPIPLPFIAYVCAALLNGLEEFENGVEASLDFGKGYTKYYRDCLCSLRRMEVKDNKNLMDIRRQIFMSGRALLGGLPSGFKKRPRLPFMGSDDVEDFHPESSGTHSGNRASTQVAVQSDTRGRENQSREAKRDKVRMAAGRQEPDAVVDERHSNSRDDAYASDEVREERDVYPTEDMYDSEGNVIDAGYDSDGTVVDTRCGADREDDTHAIQQDFGVEDAEGDVITQQNSEVNIAYDSEELSRAARRWRKGKQPEYAVYDSEEDAKLAAYLAKKRDLARRAAHDPDEAAKRATYLARKRKQVQDSNDDVGEDGRTSMKKQKRIHQAGRPVAGARLPATQAIPRPPVLYTDDGEDGGAMHLGLLPTKKRHLRSVEEDPEDASFARAKKRPRRPDETPGTEESSRHQQGSKSATAPRYTTYDLQCADYRNASIAPMSPAHSASNTSLAEVAASPYAPARVKTKRSRGRERSRSPPNYTSAFGY